MTDERHEKALEAAAKVYFDFCRKCEHSPKEDAAVIIAAYLASMDAVICEANPIAFEIDGPKHVYELTFHGLTSADKAAGFTENTLHRALPNHFTNGE